MTSDLSEWSKKFDIVSKKTTPYTPPAEEQSNAIDSSNPDTKKYDPENNDASGLQTAFNKEVENCQSPENKDTQSDEAGKSEG